MEKTRNSRLEFFKYQIDEYIRVKEGSGAMLRHVIKSEINNGASSNIKTVC